MSKELNKQITDLSASIKKVSGEIAKLRKEQQDCGELIPDDDLMLKELTRKFIEQKSAQENLVKKQDLNTAKKKKRKIEKYHPSQATDLYGHKIDPITYERLKDGDIKIYDDASKNTWTYFNPSTIKHYFMGECTCSHPFDDWKFLRYKHGCIDLDRCGDPEELSIELKRKFPEGVLNHRAGTLVFPHPITGAEFSEVNIPTLHRLLYDKSQEDKEYNTRSKSMGCLFGGAKKRKQRTKRRTRRRTKRKTKQGTKRKHKHRSRQRRYKKRKSLNY